MSLYSQYLEGLTTQYMLDEPPQTELVRFVSQDEWAQTQIDCLAGEGVAAHLGSQGGIEYDDVPTEQGPALREAAYVCAAEYAVDPRTQQQLPRVRAKMQYAYLVSTVAPCVTGLGYPVDDAPSEATWLGQYYSGSSPWDPYADATATVSVGEADQILDELYERCPHDSPDLFPPVTQ
ncbi:hypothetical protein ACTHAM_001144 [Cellulomonas soli]|uniref:hypothetical protein n=1 Tax=Cellulomonas soli TaxID=931535 RepID=UPI003F859317